MKFLVAIWVVLWCAVFVWGLAHRDDTDENGYFKFQWRFVLWFVMVLLTPFIAKFVGLI